MKKQFLWVAILLLCVNVSAQKQDKIAKTPPMGWNSWDCLGVEMNEEEIKAVADYMARNMKQYGWNYIVLDMGWNFGEGLVTKNFNTMQTPPQFIDEYGRLIPNPKRFPSSTGGKGLKPLADYIHSQGLKFGIHVMRGIPWQAVERKTPVKGTTIRANDIATDSSKCWWFHGMLTVDMTKPGAQEYYDSLLELYSEWNVDYIKADDMVLYPYKKPEIEALYKAVQKTGRPIVISLSADTPFEHAEHVSQHSNLWRITGDMWDTWHHILKTMLACRTWQNYITPGHWPDCDILPIGKLRMKGPDGALAYYTHVNLESTFNEFSRLSEVEKYTMLSLWSIFRSPLMIGGYLPEMNQFDFRLLTNKGVLAINQESINNHELRYSENEIVWTADNQKTGAKYVALFNINDEKSIPIKVSWQELGISGTYNIQDLWQKKNIRKSDNQIEITVNSHGCALLALTK
jgi:alpha-galactosidase